MPIFDFIKHLKWRYSIRIKATLMRRKFERIQNELDINCLNNSGRDRRIIISLTSYPDRIPSLHLTLYSLLRQSFKPDAIVLWLAEEQFPGGEAALPDKIKNLKKYGLQIMWYHDIKSFKKLIPALKAFPNDIIVTADDDAFYNQNWLLILYKGYQTKPSCISCHRAYSIGFDNKGDVLPYNEWKAATSDLQESYTTFFTGVGGVLYPPKVLNEDVFNEEIFMNIYPTTDDIWFWAMAVKNGTKMKVVENNLSYVIDTFPERQFFSNGIALFKKNCNQKVNDIAFKKIVEYYNFNDKIRSG
jgi:hypothetical protein